MHPLLQKQLESRSVASALLFAGPKGSSLQEAALELARALMGRTHWLKLDKGIHPDFRLYEPQGKTCMHPIETIRAITGESAMPPFEAPCRLFVIDEAHAMLPSSSNALLKTLEEPAPHTYFLLLTSEPRTLLPTVISRCQRFDFAADGGGEGEEPLLAEILKNRPLSHHRLLQSLEELETELEKEEDPNKKKKRLDAILEHVASALKESHHSPDKIFSTLEACQLAFQRSMKLSVVLEYLFLKLSV